MDGEFGEDVTVKVNAIEILNRELNPKRKRTPFKRSFLMPGGGVGDSYQPIAKKYKMPTRIPPALYSDIVSENDLVIVILEHIDYLLKLEGKKSPYGFAAYSISQLKEPLSTMKGELRKLKGVGRTTEVIIREILETGSSGYYEKMLDV